MLVHLCSILSPSGINCFPKRQFLRYLVHKHTVQYACEYVGKQRWHFEKIHSCPSLNHMFAYVCLVFMYVTLYWPICWCVPARAYRLPGSVYLQVRLSICFLTFHTSLKKKELVNLMNSIRKQSIQYGGEKSLEPLLLDWFWLNSPSHTVDLKAFADSSLSSLPCPPVSLHPDPSLSLFPFGPLLCLPSAFPCSSSLRCAEKSFSTCPLPSVRSHHTQSFPCPTGGGSGGGWR